jgi:hypothetical protein
MRGVALLLVDALVVVENLVDPRYVRAELLRSRSFTPPIARGNRKLQHLRDCIAMHAKALGRLSAAQPLHHHRTSYPGIEFHCKHPFGPSMPFRGIRIA